MKLNRLQRLIIELIILTVFAGVIAGFTFVEANADTATITANFADVNLVGGQFYVYAANGSLMGVYNTTDNSVVIPDGAMIELKPQSLDFLRNPLALPEFLINMAGPVFNSLAFLLIVVGCVLLIVKTAGR